MVYLILIHYVATLLMTGAIWLSQLSQYPLLAYVGERHFLHYEREHVRRISLIAWLIIYIELFSGLLLLFVPVPSIPLSFRIVGFLLIVGIWGMTWFVQYPIHKKLKSGFDATLHRQLVQTNWVRTTLWTARALLWTFILGELLFGVI